MEISAEPNHQKFDIIFERSRKRNIKSPLMRGSTSSDLTLPSTDLNLTLALEKSEVTIFLS